MEETLTTPGSHTHPSTNNVYKSQPPNSLSPACSILLQNIWVYYSHKFLPWQHPSQHHCNWAHPRPLRDTGNTCHGSPDLGERSSRAHTCTTCPWNAKRRRQDYGCTCKCGDSRGCPMSSGDKQAIRVTHRVHAELWTSGLQLVTCTIPPATRMITGQWTVGMGMGPIIGYPLCAVPT